MATTGDWNQHVVKNVQLSFLGTFFVRENFPGIFFLVFLGRVLFSSTADGFLFFSDSEIKAATMATHNTFC